MGRSAVALWMGSLIAAFGCSGGKSGGAPDPEPEGGEDTERVEIPASGPVEAEDLPSYLAQIACDQVSDCDCGWDGTLLCVAGGGCFEDFDTCVTGMRQLFEGFAPAEGTAQLRYSPDGGRECVDAALSSSCGDAFWESSSCSATVEGLIPLGETCTFAVECVGFSDGATICGQDGTCINNSEPPRGSAGDACLRSCSEHRGCLTHAGNSGSAECFAEDGLRCVGGECVAASLIGEGCSDSFDCEPDSYCDEAAGTCSPFLQAGEACSPEARFQCGVGAFCLDVVCAAARPDGEACDEDEQCSSDHCAFDVVCAPAGTTPICGR